jgi:DNA-binding CsgD family transcriptional regulator
MAVGLFYMVDVVPRPSPAQTRRLLGLGVALRWVTIALVTAGAMLAPSIPGILYLMSAVIVYNAAVMFLVGRAPSTWWRRIAFATTVIDQIFCLIYLAVYAAELPGGEPLGGYALGTLEAVTFFGAPGAALSVGIFLAGAGTVEMLGTPVLRQSFNRTGLLGALLVVTTLAISLVAVFRVLLAPHADVYASQDGRRPLQRQDTVADVIPSRATIRLSRRERDVLQLVAEGYSNTMIARRLGLSESTVKSYVENLLVHLNVRNRAEAVAAASRLKLL